MGRRPPLETPARASLDQARARAGRSRWPTPSNGSSPCASPSLRGKSHAPSRVGSGAGGCAAPELRTRRVLREWVGGYFPSAILTTLFIHRPNYVCSSSMSRLRPKRERPRLVVFGSRRVKPRAFVQGVVTGRARWRAAEDVVRRPELVPKAPAIVRGLPGLVEGHEREDGHRPAGRSVPRFASGRCTTWRSRDRGIGLDFLAGIGLPPLPAGLADDDRQRLTDGDDAPDASRYR